MVIQKKADAAISYLQKKGEVFDIIFMDPPYNRGFINSTLYSILVSNILSPDGFIIAEQSIEDDIPQIDGLEVYRIKDYKITKMTFLKYAER